MGHQAGAASSGASGETKTDHPGGRIFGLAWRSEEGETEDLAVEPGEPIVLVAKLEGFASPPKVVFKVLKAGGRKAQGKPLATLDGKVEGGEATATWTPEKATPPTLPLHVTFTATAGKGKPANGPTLDADIGIIESIEWAPADKKKVSAHAKPGSASAKLYFQRGDEVVLKALTHGFGKGASVKFRIFEHHVLGEEGHLVELTAQTDDDGIATSKKWKVPDSIEHEPPPPASPSPAPSPDAAESDDDDAPSADGAPDPSHAATIAKATEEEPEGAPPLPHYFASATCAGHTVRSAALPLEPGCLELLPAPPSWLLSKPARDLTLRDARRLVLQLVSWQVIRFDKKEDRARFKHEGDPPHCEITWPKIGEDALGTTHLRIRPEIDGCVWEYRFKDGYKPHVLDNGDMRAVVMIYRLTRFLREVWGAQALYHMGFGHGDAKHHPDDCHNVGRALDFSGGRGVVPESYPVVKLRGHPWDLEVEKDWGAKPVPEEWQAKSKPEGAFWFYYDKKDKKRRKISGPKASDWPTDTRDDAKAEWPFKGTNFAEVSYRLEKDAASDDLDKLAAHWFFKDVYAFATQQCSDRSGARQAYDARTGAGKGKNPNDTPTAIGPEPSFICNPDHHDRYIRQTHYNHFHIQVGPTGKEEDPPVE